MFGGDIDMAIAIGLALAGTLALALAVLAARRRRRASERELARMLQESNERTESMLADLARALDHARDEGERSRRLASIGASLDLDDVLARTLEAATALRSVHAALVVIPGGDGVEPIVASRGMSEDETARHAASASVQDERSARAVTLKYRRRQEKATANGALIAGGAGVPLFAHDARVGTLAVFWRDGDGELPEHELAELEEVAASAGPAIENARRFREARQLADLDALTGLHNRRFFHETLGREVTRALRYDRRLALIIFDIDDFKAINDRIGHLSGDAVLARVAERAKSVVRASDIACRVGGDEFAVILPETTLEDAEQLYRRLQFAVSSRAASPADRIPVSAGVAELAAGHDPVSFFERADEALYRAKKAGKGQVAAQEERG